MVPGSAFIRPLLRGENQFRIRSTSRVKLPLSLAFPRMAPSCWFIVGRGRMSRVLFGSFPRWEDQVTGSVTWRPMMQLGHQTGRRSFTVRAMTCTLRAVTAVDLESSSPQPAPRAGLDGRPTRNDSALACWTPRPRRRHFGKSQRRAETFIRYCRGGTIPRLSVVGPGRPMGSISSSSRRATAGPIYGPCARREACSGRAVKGRRS